MSSVPEPEAAPVEVVDPPAAEGPPTASRNRVAAFVALLAFCSFILLFGVFGVFIAFLSAAAAVYQIAFKSGSTIEFELLGWSLLAVFGILGCAVCGVRCLRRLEIADWAGARGVALLPALAILGAMIFVATIQWSVLIIVGSVPGVLYLVTFLLIDPNPRSAPPVTAPPGGPNPG